MVVVKRLADLLAMRAGEYLSRTLVVKQNEWPEAAWTSRTVRGSLEALASDTSLKAVRAAVGTQEITGTQQNHRNSHWYLPRFVHQNDTNYRCTWCGSEWNMERIAMCGGYKVCKLGV